MIRALTIITTLLCALALASKESSSSQQTAPTVRFPNAGLRLHQPPGFVKETAFEGLGQRETQSSVLILRIPGPFAEVNRGFSADLMKPRGMELLSKESITIDSLPGLLLHIKQSAGGTTFEKWTAAFGDQKQTFMVTATFPESEAGRLSEILKSVVLSAKLEGSPDPTADIPFTIQPSGPMKAATAMGRSLAFTRGGKFPATSAREPLFVASPYVGQPVEDNARVEFARRRLFQTDQVKGISVVSHKVAKFGSVDVVESVSNGLDRQSGIPMTLYQAVLFDPRGAVIMQGLVGRELERDFLAHFRAMARSYRRK